MPEKPSPRLRTVDKVKPPYPLNEFPHNFGIKLGKEIIYLLATRSTSDIKGEEWERIFASCIGAEWTPSNVGLDDVVLEPCTWGAKTVKGRPSTAKKIRLISGRNSLNFSYGDSDLQGDPNDMGEKVLGIWNDRVSSVRSRFKHVRTIVLIKGTGLEEVAVFEFETVLYPPDEYEWQWNNNGNLLGYSRSNHTHRFTWQPHGSQFTIVEDVPEHCLIIRVKVPPKLDRDGVFKTIVYEDTWITVTERNVR
jgi:hypothetical protein